MKAPTDFATLIQTFFCEHLLQQKGVSPRTVNVYRDTFRLWLEYLRRVVRKPTEKVQLSDLSADNVIGFLQYLEKKRRNSVRTRNVRLAAIRSFVHYVIAVRAPDRLSELQRILTIPCKRFVRPLIGFLSREEMEAILQAADHSWTGCRDRLLLTLLYNTGARVSEIIHLRVQDVKDHDCRSVQLLGKGRKQRVVPLWNHTRKLLRHWLKLNNFNPGQVLLPNRFGQPLTRAGVQDRLTRARIHASQSCPSLQNRRVSPHVLRHTTAMHLLQSGVAPTVIALWLGHESPSTTHLYVEADLALKEKALQQLKSPKTKSARFQAKTELLRFLETL